MKALTRTEILGANDVKIEKVDVKEWGGYVFVKGLSGTERDAWENSLYDIKQKNQGQEITMKRDNIRARFVSISVVDESGTLMFSPADIDALGKKSAAALERIFVKAQQLSGLTKDDMDTLEKNLNSVPDDTSITS